MLIALFLIRPFVRHAPNALRLFGQRKIIMQLSLPVNRFHFDLSVRHPNAYLLQRCT